MSDDDPIRWAEGGGPPGALELVRAIERTPAVPPALRSAMPRRLGPRQLLPRTRMIGGAVATAVVIGGLALWVWPRPHEPLMREPAAIVSGEEVLVGQSVPISGEVPRAAELGVPRTPLASHVPDGELRAPQLHPVGRRTRPDAGEAAVTEVFAPDAEPSGYLTLNSSPWSRVFLDGNDTGHNTPVVRLRVPAGQHRVRFKTPDGVTVETTVDVQAEQTTTIVRQLDPATGAADRLERARQLMLAGNNTGVIALLQGARSQQELELLIATYTNIGNTAAKLAAMQRYIERFPTTPRARQYEQVLMRQGRPSGIDEDE